MSIRRGLFARVADEKIKVEIPVAAKILDGHLQSIKSQLRFYENLLATNEEDLLRLKGKEKNWRIDLAVQQAVVEELDTVKVENENKLAGHKECAEGALTVYGKEDEKYLLALKRFADLSLANDKFLKSDYKAAKVKFLKIKSVHDNCLCEISVILKTIDGYKVKIKKLKEEANLISNKILDEFCKTSPASIAVASVGEPISAVVPAKSKRSDLMGAHARLSFSTVPQSVSSKANSNLTPPSPAAPKK